MTTPSDIITYLASIKNAQITRMLPCYVTIGRQTYPAARYIEICMTPEGGDAWRRGERAYEREMIYCVGMLPSVKRRGNVAFNMTHCHRDWSDEIDQRDWYVAAYYGAIKDRKQDSAEPNEYHPFGNMFLLAPWTVTDGLTIDHHERVPYRRVGIHVGL